MLTGEVPFKGGYAEAIFHAIKFEPVPPLARTDRDIPDVLERIVLRALEKDPAGRYQSARELARTPPAAGPHRAAGSSHGSAAGHAGRAAPGADVLAARAA